MDRIKKYRDNFSKRTNEKYIFNDIRNSEVHKYSSFVTSFKNRIFENESLTEIININVLHHGIINLKSNNRTLLGRGE